jgi:predicted RNA-binding protein YlqC (UPF0109 family)
MGGSIWLIGRRGKTIEALGVSADMERIIERRGKELIRIYVL